MSLRVGERVLDRYRVIEQIAAGGTSVVYRAEDERLARPVCVKVFHTLEAGPGAQRASYEHFVQEAFALSRLAHPHTLRIYDFGVLGSSSGSVPVQVSEYMDRGTLYQRVKREGPLGVDEARRVALALCDALGEAHDAGIVHRDIKPQNILFGSAGAALQPKLADFGIASVSPTGAGWRSIADAEVAVARPLHMFSQRWAAPEQLRGGAVDRRTDIYSLALVTHFMVAGRPLLSVCNPSESYHERARTDALIDRSLARAGAPLALVHLLRRACSLRREDRPTDTAAFARALAQSVPASSDREVALGARLEPPESAARTRRRRRPEPRVLPVTAEPQSAGERVAKFVALRAEGIELLCPGAGGRLQLGFPPAVRASAALHVKALSAFVRPSGGRASGAVLVERDVELELIDPRQRVLGRLSVSFGRVEDAHTVFTVGSERFAIARAECAQPVLLDFDAEGTCYFVFAPPIGAQERPPPPAQLEGDRHGHEELGE